MKLRIDQSLEISIIEFMVHNLKNYTSTLVLSAVIDVFNKNNDF